ncbi:carbamoyltransferase HypF [Anaeromusa acidaminophila]|uniref:carbamoyltransferase HypF n=1 Tax=Anaeromusa acidaminophila TaxID=81464 RepID=UPI00037E7AFB|nr:carbamoyltransferase HypF [Anaeromusa acidaminophila]
MEDGKERWQVLVEGIVQGVGFRPFVHNLAQELQLAGFVCNTGAGVLAEVEGEAASLQEFMQRLEAEAPPMALVERIECQVMQATGENKFVIKQSLAGETLTLVSPDMATCAECQRELLEPTDRRYRYAFINCTHCGPRYTIIKDLPYDRPQTTMAGFFMCQACQEEYESAADRRFHAQPNACAVCGPAYRLIDATGTDFLLEAGEDIFQGARRKVKEGAILAVKGIGGYHLACDAKQQEAVRRLRRRKGREKKPLAVMCREMEQVRKLCYVSPQEEKLLLSPARPVVLLRKRYGEFVAEEVAPGNDYLGVMLPYAPVHWLLLEKTGVWVMTSGNASGEPMVRDETEALACLGGLADFFLMHNRSICRGVDDSVARVLQGDVQLLRRGRGYAPRPIRLPFEMPSLLSAGGELKNTFCLTRGAYAFMSPHIGDMASEATYDSFVSLVAHLECLFKIKPKAVAYDSHPAYLTGQYAQKSKLPHFPVQHHHAHAAAVMAEHSLKGPALALVFDGTGYGDDGKLWGGEFLLAQYEDFQRLAHFSYRPLPGGEQAVRQPWRLAAWVWQEVFGSGEALTKAPFPEGWRTLMQAVCSGLAAPHSSSVGRLFDAASAILEVCPESHYEGQAAIELEQLAAGNGTAGIALAGCRLRTEEETWQVDAAPLLASLLEKHLQGENAAALAAAFHQTLGQAVLDMTCLLAQKHKVNQVVLGGGVWQNALLQQQVRQGLKEAGLKAYMPVQLPVNDGGLAYGQAVVAGAILRQRGSLIR